MGLVFATCALDTMLAEEGGSPCGLSDDIVLSVCPGMLSSGVTTECGLGSDCLPVLVCR